MSNEHNCPWCNAPFWHFTGVNTRRFQCGSDTQIPSVACKYASCLQGRIKRLEEANQQLESLNNKTREINRRVSQERYDSNVRNKILGDALKETVNWIVNLANSEGAEYLDAEIMPEVIQARAALKAKEAKL